MAERRCPAVTNDGRFGKWRYHLCFGKKALEQVLEGKKPKETELELEG